MPLDTDRVPLTGTWWRQVRHGLAPLELREPRGDGRWQRGELTGALYLADGEATVWAEWYRALAERALPPRIWLPCDLWRIEVELEDVADLSDPDRLARVGLSPPRPDRRGWPRYQDVGEALFGEGCPALLAPSAARPEGLVLCVFEPAARPPGLQPASRPTVVREPPARRAASAPRTAPDQQQHRPQRRCLPLPSNEKEAAMPDQTAPTDRRATPAESAPGRAAERREPVGRPALSGDEAELFRRYSGWLVRITRHRLGCSEALAEDACAHAWLQLCRTQPRRTESLPTWLRVVALHEGLRLLRKEPWCERLDKPVGHDDGGGSLTLADVLAGDFDLERTLEAREALRALAGLRWRRRRALAIQAAGYSYREIAERLGVTYTNVNRHVTEGRAELRELREAA